MGRQLIYDFAKDDAIRTKHHYDALQVVRSHLGWLMTHIYFQEIEAGLRVKFKEDDTRAVHLDCAEAVLRNLIDIFKSHSRRSSGI